MEKTTADKVPATATKKEWIGLLVLALPCLLYSMDLTVLNLAIPQLSLDLRPSPSQLLWIVDVYGFFLAGSLITMGTLGDRIGRRKILLIGSGVFALASAAAAFSRSPEILIAMRALQGIAGATLAPSTLSLIRVLFRNPKQRAFAVGLWGTSFSVGALIGPLLGGLLIEHFWWGSVFLINFPFMILLMFIGPILLPEYKDPQAGKLDLLSAALSLTGILSIVFGLKKATESGFDGISLAAIFAGLVICTLFLRRQKKLKDPLIDLSLFKAFSFDALIATNSLTMFVTFGTLIFTAQYLQLVLGLSPLVAGLWSLPSSFMMMLSSSMSPLLARKIRPAYVMSLGLVFGASGFILLSLVGGDYDLTLIVLGTTLCSLGISPVLLFTTNMIVNSAPSEKAGAAAGISETGNELGGALGIALLGSLGTLIYRSRMAQLLPSDLPKSLREIADTTLENALYAAHQITGPSGRNVAVQATTAYTTAFKAVMALAALILILLIGLVLGRLRSVRMDSEHGD